MIHQQYILKDKRLEPYINCIWYIKHEPGDDGFSYYPKMTANLNPDLIINLSSGFVYEYKDESFYMENHHFCFLNTHYYMLDHGHDTQLIGVQFSPVGLYRLLGRNMEPFINCIVELENINPLLAMSVNNAIKQYGTTGEIDELVERIEDILIQSLLIRPKDEMEENTIRLLEKINSQIEVKNYRFENIHEGFNVSKRTLERHFKRVIGISMSKYIRMARILDLIKKIAEGSRENLDWQQLVYEYGFYDQPHMIKEFKEHLGYPPSQYKNKKDLLEDFYG